MLHWCRIENNRRYWGRKTFLLYFRTLPFRTDLRFICSKTAALGCSHEPSPCPPHEAVYRGTTVHGARCVCVHGYAARARARVSARAHRPRPRPPKERAWRGPSRRRAQGVFMLQNRGWGSAKISMSMMRPSSFMMRRQQSTMPVTICAGTCTCTCTCTCACTCACRMVGWGRIWQVGA